MRILTLLVLSLCCFTCAEKQEIRFATAENDFISGTFSGQNFNFAGQNNLEALTYYFVADKITTNNPYPVISFMPGLLPEQGLYLGRMDERQKDIVYLKTEDSQLHLQSYPYTASTATLSWAKFDYSTGGCPHPDLSTAEELPVVLTISEWGEKFLVGSFVGVDNNETKGTFQVIFPRPE
ncbi:MAG: hypothetical protein AAGA31_12860 [Bacteroidota bacterium]